MGTLPERYRITAISSFQAMISWPDPIQSRPNLCPAAVIGQMRPAMNQGLGADEEIRQNRFVLSLGRSVLAEHYPGPPGGFGIQRRAAKDGELLVHVLPCPRAACQLGLRHG